MNAGTALAVAGLAALLVRQLFVLSAILRSARFLTRPSPTVAPAEGPMFVVVVPVLRETAIIAETVGHLQNLTGPHGARLVVVTTAREDTEAEPGSGPTTSALAAELAASGNVIHLHYPDPAGLKADQLNYAADHCAATLPASVPADRVFLVCYDADSRPPVDSLAYFARAIAAHPQADVFHQSSRFELRHHRTTRRRWWAESVCDGGALHANRFVLGFELPRLLNRTPAAGPWRRRAGKYAYAHVTGHGLCIRLSALRELPLPAHSPLEDMHHSFVLCSRQAPMIPVASLDVAEVPSTPAGRIGQAARWYFGPARALRYLRDPATHRGLRSYLVAASALGSAGEWIGCAVVPPLLLAAAWYAYPLGLLLAAAVAGVYAAQLLVAEAYLGGRDRPLRRAVRIMTCPIAATLHGIGGIVGAIRLAKGGTGVGKTERQ